MDAEEEYLPYIDKEYKLPGMKTRVDKLLEEEMKEHPNNQSEYQDETNIYSLPTSVPPKFDICPEAEYEMLSREEIYLRYLLNIQDGLWDKEIAKLEQKYNKKKQELNQINEEIRIVNNQRREEQERADLEFRRLKARAAFNTNKDEK